MTSEDLAARGAPELDEALADLRKAVEGGHPWHPGDFEAFTPKRAKTVATILNAVLDGSLLPAALAASPVDDILAQLADAKAAQAMVVERAAKAGADAAVAYWVEAKKPIGERKHGGSGVPGFVMKEILTLADTDGLALVRALRAERDAAHDRADGWMASSGEGWRIVDVLRADRDRLAAANAALEAQVRALREALELADAALAGANIDMKHVWRKVKSALAEVQEDDPPCTCCDGTGITKQTERFCSCEVARAALAAVQADARREGGE